jgi:hypothetical protein
MKDDVEANRFYIDDGDKVKLNWFCYEYANIYFMEIKSDPKLARYRKGHTDAQISSFCAYFSKRIRKSVYDRQAGRADDVVLSGAYVHEFYPKSSMSLTRLLIGAASDAWDEQMGMCGSCPANCLSDGFELCGMFDSLETTGWPT